MMLLIIFVKRSHQCHCIKQVQGFVDISILICLDPLSLHVIGRMAWDGYSNGLRLFIMQNPVIRIMTDINARKGRRKLFAKL